MCPAKFNFTATCNPQDLDDIRALGSANQLQHVPEGEHGSHGFLSMNYTLTQLAGMCDPYPHVVAKLAGRVVGYALVMLPHHRAEYPALRSMFDSIDLGVFNEKPVRQQRYVVMGQVCVAQDCRGQGVFEGLYHRFREQLRADFDLVVTEVSTRNLRSLRAHQNVGFRPLQLPPAPDEGWHVIAWDWADASARRPTKG